jgi:hypothetical protein
MCPALTPAPPHVDPKAKGATEGFLNHSQQQKSSTELGLLSSCYYLDSDSLKIHQVQTTATRGGKPGVGEEAGEGGGIVQSCSSHGLRFGFTLSKNRTWTNGV